jgi:hypothetical protein
MNEMMLASEMHHEPRFSDFMDIEMTSLSWFGANNIVDEEGRKCND